MKNTLIAAVIAVVISVGFGVAFSHQPKTLPKPGSLAGPDIPWPYLQWGGIPEWRNSSSNLIAATTTPCNIQSPASTSTLVMASVRFETSSSSATQLYWGKATTMSATTTNLGYGTLGANAKGTFLASTTPTATGSTVDPAYVFGPSQWLNLGMAGGIGTFSPVGQCEAIWLQN